MNIIDPNTADADGIELADRAGMARLVAERYRQPVEQFIKIALKEHYGQSPLPKTEFIPIEVIETITGSSFPTTLEAIRAIRMYSAARVWETNLRTLESLDPPIKRVSRRDALLFVEFLSAFWESGDVIRID